MAHTENGVRFATTDKEIRCMLNMAKRVHAAEGWRREPDYRDAQDREFIGIVLEEELPEKEFLWEKLLPGQADFCVSRLMETETASAYRLTGRAGLSATQKAQERAFHLFCFTYNADGPLRPVGIGDTVFASDGDTQLDNTCTIRKAMLDHWHLGALMSVVIRDDDRLLTAAQIVALTEEQKQYFERTRSRS